MQPEFSESPKTVFQFSFDVDAIIGVYAFERRHFQPLHIHLDVHDASHIAYDQEELVSRTKDFLSHHHPQLLETLAYNLARHILEHWPTMNSLTLTIQKPTALHDAQFSFSTVYVKRAAHQNGL